MCPEYFVTYVSGRTLSDKRIRKLNSDEIRGLRSLGGGAEEPNQGQKIADFVDLILGGPSNLALTSSGG